MTNQDLDQSLHRIYWLTAVVAAIGFVSYFGLQGPRSAFGFLLGALGSFGNLALFVWLSRAIAPGDPHRRAWKAGAFVLRYVVLFTIGYVIVHALGVNVLAVVLGLFASTAAVLLSSVVEIFHGFSETSGTH
ncbi:MAG: ATP synthase subunit I [Acidobacteriaceae bacterium]|nr:ATP synthase subunit I [Acidobacteriaceae bacterium]MBV9779738.1 ATP synthase subunit I [Acidobacteriaceae bacterium]